MQKSPNGTDTTGTTGSANNNKKEEKKDKAIKLEVIKAKDLQG